MADVLLVIDVQRALLDELTPARRADLLRTLAPSLERARSTGLPVVYVRHDGSPAELLPGTPDWEIAGDVAPRAGEPIVEKRFENAFEQTVLGEVLASLGADHVIVAGMQTDHCVAATIGGATERGFRVTLLSDAHATSTANEPQVRDAMHAEALARGARLVPAAGLFAESGAETRTSV